MWIRLIIGVALGAAIGGVIGYVGKCRSGTCPLTSNPISGSIWGALIGAALVLMLGPVVGGQGFGSEEVAEVESPEALADLLSESDRPVLVDFYGPRCPACHVLAPTIGELADRFEGQAHVVAVNGDRNPQALREYGVRAYPTVVLFRDGIEIDRWVGAKNAEVYREALASIIQQEPAGRSQSPPAEPRETPDDQSDPTNQGSS